MNGRLTWSNNAQIFSRPLTSTAFWNISGLSGTRIVQSCTSRCLSLPPHIFRCCPVWLLPRVARRWLDSVEELVFSHECFRGEVPQSQFNLRWEKERVQCIQSSYLVCTLQKRECTVEAQARTRRYRHASMVAVRYLNQRATQESVKILIAYSLQGILGPEQPPIVT